MCTVTLIPNLNQRNGFILTSNRDEAAGREATVPDFYIENNVKMLYPKDKLSGGTWIGVSEQKRLICLLNGEFEPHVRQPSYRLSRGVVVKDLLKTGSLHEGIETYDFANIEPFTIVAVDWHSNLQFIELVWDGRKKHYKELDQTSHIWSSSPLYTSGMKKIRENWFREFQLEKSVDAESLWKFHNSAGIGNPDLGVIMDRGFVKTQNISQIENTMDATIMRFMDLKEKNKIEYKF